MRGTKYIWGVLCLALIAVLLGGCGKNGTGNDTLSGNTDGIQKGRYVETQEVLPEELEGWNIRQLFALEDGIHLLVIKQEEGTILREWAQQNGAFADVTQGWLKGIELPIDGSWMNLQLMQTGDGIQYLFAGYVAQGEEEYKSHLWKENGEEAQEITPMEWTVFNEEWDGYEMILGMAALNNKTLTAVSYTSIDILDGGDGSIQESEDVFAVYDSILTNGESIYLGFTHGDNASGFEIEKRKCNLTE